MSKVKGFCSSVELELISRVSLNLSVKPLGQRLFDVNSHDVRGPVSGRQLGDESNLQPKSASN